MSHHIDLEQGSRRQSFPESDVNHVSERFYSNVEDHVFQSYNVHHSNTYGYYPDNNYEGVSSSVSKSEESVCRICQLEEVGSDGQDQELIELGCSCKEDLAFAHPLCAETWFKLKGNKVCEICNSVATNVAGGNERIEEEVAVVVGEGGGDAAVTENRESWWERRWMAIITLICWVLVFLIYLFQSKFKFFSNLF